MALWIACSPQKQALIYAQGLAAADPLREETHCELMRLYHLLGRSQAALKQFATLHDLLTDELGDSPAHWRNWWGPARLGAIAPLPPLIAERFPDLPPLAPLDPQEEQRRLWEGLARCLAGLATIAPLLLILEDLHWSDETSLEALPHLVPCTPANCLLLVLTCRTAEAERAAVHESLEALDRAVLYCVCGCCPSSAQRL